MKQTKERVSLSVENELDDLLTQWAENEQLGEVRSRAIRDLALNGSAKMQPALTYHWWRKVFAKSVVSLPSLKVVRISPLWKDCQTRIIWSG